jgi:hypothetical protein
MLKNAGGSQQLFVQRVYYMKHYFCLEVGGLHSREQRSIDNFL